MRLLKSSRRVVGILIAFQLVIALSQITGNHVAWVRAVSPADLECNQVSSEIVLDSWGNIHFYD